jgi:hypothetical protein
VLSDQVVPPPERWTVLGVGSEVECDDGPMEGDAVSRRDDVPRGAVFAPVAPSRRGRPDDEDLLSSLLT